MGCQNGPGGPSVCAGLHTLRKKGSRREAYQLCLGEDAYTTRMRCNLEEKSPLNGRPPSLVKLKPSQAKPGCPRSLKKLLPPQRHARH